MRRMLSALCHFVLSALPSATPCNTGWPRDGKYTADAPTGVGRIRYNRAIRPA